MPLTYLKSAGSKCPAALKRKAQGETFLDQNKLAEYRDAFSRSTTAYGAPKLIKKVTYNV